MKRSLLILSVLLFHSAACISQLIHTDPVTDIKIHSAGSKLSFIDRYEACDSALFRETVDLLLKGMRKYPPELLRKRLKNIYVYKSLIMDSISYGGTYFGRDLYVTHRDGLSYIENIFHHELMSILMLFDSKKFDFAGWEAANPPGFKYWDKTEGRQYLKTHKTSVPSFEETFLKEGFLSGYSMASMDNDISRYAENIFLSDTAFWTAVDKYKSVKQKTLIVIGFYSKLNARFSESYFRQIK